jgi:ribulose-phosphate 3-epimerase
MRYTLAMSIICPTILADNSHELRDQIERVAGFAKRIQIDLTDGIFTKNKTVELKHVWIPDGVETDIHLMYQEPETVLGMLLALNPSMVIIHAESSTDIPLFASKLRENGIKTGIALLPETHVKDVAYLLPHVQHILLFAGSLGSFGGHARLGVLDKVVQIRKIDKRIEIGWDGGVNNENCQKIAEAGVQVINVGGAIQNSEKPQDAYATMEVLITSMNNA